MCFWCASAGSSCAIPLEHLCNPYEILCNLCQKQRWNNPIVWGDTVKVPEIRGNRPAISFTEYAIIRRMLHVGLTGNIASGKSHAARIFAELGAHIIDADKIAHDLIFPETPTYRKILDVFGPEILDPDRAIDRRKLGSIVFRDGARRMELNAIVHPEVRTEVLRRIVELEQVTARGIIIVDAALIVESGSYKLYDRIIVVHCDLSLQLSRVMARNNRLTADEARARMAAQMPAEEKLKYADYTIETSGTFRETRDQVDEVYRDLTLTAVRIQNPPGAEEQGG